MREKGRAGWKVVEGDGRNVGPTLSRGVGLVVAVVADLHALARWDGGVDGGLVAVIGRGGGCRSETACELVVSLAGGGRRKEWLGRAEELEGGGRRGREEGDPMEGR